MTEDQLHEAEAVFKRLSGKPHSLSFWVDYALANFREPARQKPIAGAIADYIALREHELAQDLISEPYLVRLRREMNRLPKRCPAVTVSELTSARLVTYFEFGRASRKTYNNRRGVISGFLKFAQQRDWIAENPLTKIPAHRIRRRRGGAQTLTATQAQELMEFVAKFRSIGEAALQAGNSESIIRKHYLDLKDPAEAELFFGPARGRSCGGFHITR